MTKITVSTIRELIEVLGGPTKTGELLGGVSTQVVVNWRNRGRITPSLYVHNQAKLKERGIVAPPELWGQSL